MNTSDACYVCVCVCGVCVLGVWFECDVVDTRLLHVCVCMCACVCSYHIFMKLWDCVENGAPYNVGVYSE
jgi:hypothetical protein